MATFKLEQNYRSTKTIVEAANQVIKNNKDQLHKKVWTSNPEGNKIKLIKCLNESEEGNFITEEIIKHKTNERCNENDFAVLYRTNAQSRALEEALRRKNIAYRIYGGISFYQRKEIKDLLAYFKLCINPKDEEAFKRIINYPTRGLGQTTVDKVVIAASEEGKSPWDIVIDLEEANLNINGGTKERLTEFRDMIRGFQITASDQDAFEVANKIASSTGILKELYQDKSPEGVSRYENIQELLNGIKEFTEIPLLETELEVNNPRSIAKFMEDVALLTDQDTKDDKEDPSPKVSLMTIHSAKGLEFPYVFIAGLEDGLFPSEMSSTSRADLEEERRLFYVALTRAEKLATLSYASTRFRYGNIDYCEPSRFLSEIDSTIIDSPSVQKVGKRELNTLQSYKLANHVVPRRLAKPEDSGSVLSAEEMSKLQIGTHVKHERFGSGEIVGLEGDFPNKKATVDFKGVGRKQLLLKFAKLQIVD